MKTEKYLPCLRYSTLNHVHLQAIKFGQCIVIADAHIRGKFDIVEVIADLVERKLDGHVLCLN
jgi:D-mannonate dehydratase